MSLFRWLFPAQKSKAPASTPGLPRAQASGRKGERMARRELLYAVVRQTMTRAGVLSSGYKFKVLSLDPKGHHFLVMIDLAHPYGGDPSRLTDMESMIAQAAKVRHDIVVNAVYWRINEQAAVGVPAQGVSAGSAGRPVENSQPAVLDSHPAPLESAASRAGPRYEPIQPDEVAAFKSALAAGVPASVAVAQSAPAASANGGASARAFDGAGKHGPQSYTLLTGFEDTELPEGRVPVLSGTQYGELN